MPISDSSEDESLGNSDYNNLNHSESSNSENDVIMAFDSDDHDEDIFQSDGNDSDLEHDPDDCPTNRIRRRLGSFDRDSESSDAELEFGGNDSDLESPHVDDPDDDDDDIHESIHNYSGSENNTDNSVQMSDEMDDMHESVQNDSDLESNLHVPGSDYDLGSGIESIENNSHSESDIDVPDSDSEVNDYEFDVNDSEIESNYLSSDISM